MLPYGIMGIPMPRPMPIMGMFRDGMGIMMGEDSFALGFVLLRKVL